MVLKFKEDKGNFIGIKLNKKERVRIINRINENELKVNWWVINVHYI